MYDRTYTCAKGFARHHAGAPAPLTPTEPPETPPTSIVLFTGVPAPLTPRRSKLGRSWWR